MANLLCSPFHKIDLLAYFGVTGFFIIPRKRHLAAIKLPGMKSEKCGLKNENTLKIACCVAPLIFVMSK